MSIFGKKEKDWEKVYQEAITADSDRKTEKLLKEAAENGHVPSQARLGYYYVVGDEGIKRDLPKGLALVQKAAEQGNAEAQDFLGTLHRSGIGVPQDYAEAAELYRKAVAQGYEKAQEHLASLKNEGKI